MALELGPVDEAEMPFGIQVPLPIAPVRITSGKRKYNKDHHHAFFPSDSEHLATNNQRVVRWSRLQYGYRWLHNRYHEEYEGVQLPQSEHEVFMTSLLCSAGYIPPQAVDVSGSKPRIITLDEPTRAQLLAPGVIHQQYDRHWAVGLFYGNYILRHGLEAVLEASEVTQFMEEKDELKKMKLGFSVMRLAASVVVDPLESTYQQAWNRGLISQELQPNRAIRFLMKHFDQHQPDYFPELEQQLIPSL